MTRTRLWLIALAALLAVGLVACAVMTQSSTGTGTGSSTGTGTGTGAGSSAGQSTATGTPAPGQSGGPKNLGEDPASGLPYIAESKLPEQAQQVLEAIRNGGPFEFEEDGGHFGNYEGLLPKKKSSYYSEYTVQMPGDKTRGAHRFVVGDGGEIYWTDDHYESFSVVKEGA